MAKNQDLWVLVFFVSLNSDINLSDMLYSEETTMTNMSLFEDFRSQSNHSRTKKS